MGPQGYENKPGKYKVIGVDTFAHEDWLVGYYDTVEAAKQVCPGGEMGNGKGLRVRRQGAVFVWAREILMRPAERIAAAPRAWAIKYYDYPINFRDTGPFREDLELEAGGQSGARVVPIAIVELKDEEA